MKGVHYAVGSPRLTTAFRERSVSFVSPTVLGPRSMDFSL
jgi:hypothetical protein